MKQVNLETQNRKNGALAARMSTVMTAVIFVAAGAVPIFVAMGDAAGLHFRETISILLWGSGWGSLLSIYLSYRLKTPVFAAASITAVAIMIPLLQQFTLGEIVFGYLAAGVMLFLLGALKLISKIAGYLPLPIVLAMVAGIYMSYGLDLIQAVGEIPVAGGMIVAAFFGILLFTKRIPPQAAAVFAALMVTILMLPHGKGLQIDTVFSVPVFILPEFRPDILLYISLPLLIVGISDLLKGYGVLRANDYEVPLDYIACVCGIGSIIGAFGLTHMISLAGPGIAIVAGKDAGPQDKRYIGTMIFCGMTAGLILGAGVLIAVLHWMPEQVLTIICGLAMIGLLTSSLQTAFGQRKFELGALTSFVIGLSHITIAGIGAPVWAIVGGVLVSLLAEREDFSQMGRAEG